MTASQGRPPAPTVQKTIRHPAAVDVRTWKRKETDKTSTEGSLVSSRGYLSSSCFPPTPPLLCFHFSTIAPLCWGRVVLARILFRMPNACLGSMGSGFHTQLRRACSASLHEYNESLSDRPRIVDSQRIMTVVNQTFQGKKNQTLFATPFDMSRGLCLSRFD